jgi:hypothetical protein
MNNTYAGSEQDFSLFDSGMFSATAEKKLIDRLLKAPFVDDPRLRMRLASYVLQEAWERDRIVLQLAKFFFREDFPAGLFAVEREFDFVLGATGRRGHFVHQFEVLVFGWALIDMLFNYDARVHEAFHFTTKREIFSVWLATSLVHDFGYPLQMGSDVMKKFSEWYRALGMSEVADLYTAAQEQYDTKKTEGLKRLASQSWRESGVRAVVLEGLQEALGFDQPTAEDLLRDIESEKTHGHSAAMLLCARCFQSWQDRGISAVTPLDMTRLKFSTAAICLHDLSDTLYKYRGKIEFWRNPYAYVLFLVDNLQDWSRDLRRNEGWPSYNLVKVEEGDGSLGLSYILTYDKWTPELEQKAKDSIEEKSKKLALLARPDPPLNFRIDVSFRTTSRGQKVEPLAILL